MLHSIKVSLILYLLCSFCGLMSLQGQSNISVDHYTKDYGQYYRWVYDITQDKHGFMWFANHTGLRRYDGRNFLTYSHSATDSNSISTNTIRSVTTDSAGNIWAYGEDQVFNRLDLISGKFTKISSFYKDEHQVQTPGQLRDWKTLKNGGFIILMQGNGPEDQASLWKYEPQRNGFAHLMNIHTDGVQVHHISEASTGEVWLWSLGIGFFSVDLRQHESVYHPAPLGGNNGQQIEKAPSTWHRRLQYPAISADTLKGDLELQYFNIPDSLDVHRIERLTKDNLDHIWFYYGEADVYQFDTKLKKLRRYTDPIFKKSRGLQIMSHFFVDKEGAFWNGHFVGAIRFRPRSLPFNTYLDPTVYSPAYTFGSSISTRDIIELSPQVLLVKDDRHDLYEIDVAENQVKRIKRNPLSVSGQEINKQFYSMVASDDGYLWLNQSDKLLRQNLETGEVEIYPLPELPETRIDKDDPFQTFWPRLFKDATNKIWWCDAKGIYIFDRSTKKLSPVEVAHPVPAVGGNFKYASYDAVSDAIYASYGLGIYRLDCKSETVSLIEIFERGESYDLLCTAILFWKDKYWLCSNKGLIKYDPLSKKRTHFTIRDGLPSNLVFSAMVSNNRLWIATQKGLAQFDPDQMRVVKYGIEQGLPTNEFNIWSYKKGSKGLLYFGSQKGIVEINPAKLQFPVARSERLNILEVTKYNEDKDRLVQIKNLPYSKIDKIIVGATERNLSFKYMLANYSDLSKVQYYHYMENFDRGWINDGSMNEVRFAGIAPGNYTFRARAVDARNNSSENEIAISIIVQQYWYLRWWALLVYALIVIGGIGMLYKHQLKLRLNKEEAKRMRELDQVRTRMYANVTHEFRTPLTVILGMNETIKDYIKDGDLLKVGKAQDMIGRNGQNLLNLINQMLEISKLEAGKVRLNNLQGDIVAYLKYRLESFHSYAAERGINIHLVAESDEIIMDYDVDMLTYIVGNLVSNAIKYSNENDDIYVYARELFNSSSHYLELVVKDSGIGIEQSKLKHIFDRFYQVDGSSTRKREGTGIGLAVVKEIITLLKGHIQAESKVGKGSQFTVHLPITRMAPKSLQEPAAISDEWSAYLANSQVIGQGSFYEEEGLPLALIVEDHMDVSHYIGACLRGQYRTIFASNGNEGLAQAAAHIPDVIISDVMMPEMDGFELCETLKKDEKTSHIPLILLTGKADIESKIEGLTHGADAYLAKPFHRKELLIRLKNLMALRQEMQKRFSQSEPSQAMMGLPKIENVFLQKIESIILENIEEDSFNIPQLCRLLHLSRAQLHRKLTALTGASTSHFIRKIRLAKAKELLTHQDLNVGEVAYQTGFKTAAHFSRVFNEAFGKSPSEFRKEIV